MNKKGYSLVEILTVFILLGVVAGIVYSLTNNIKKDAKLEALKSSAKKLFVIAENYDAQNDYKSFPVEGLRIDQLDIEITSFTAGKVKVNPEGKYELVNITDGSYCINGVLEDLKIEKGICSE